MPRKSVLERCCPSGMVTQRDYTPVLSSLDIGHWQLLAVKTVIEKWHHWLEKALHLFTVLTNHRNLECTRQTKRLNSRQARWALLFTCFRFTISYRPGSKNAKADALSQQHSLPEKNKTKSIVPLSLMLAPVTWIRFGQALDFLVFVSYYLLPIQSVLYQASINMLQCEIAPPSCVLHHPRGVFHESS